MKKKKVFLVSLLTVLAFTFVLLPAKTAFAASVTVSPDSGRVDTFTLVNGSGFTASIAYTIYFAYDTPYEVTTDGTVAGDGTISRIIIIPEVPGGEYDVRVETASESASDVFTVDPEMELNKTSALVGEEVVVLGSGFRSSRRVTIRFDNRTVEFATTSSRGSFRATFAVPEADRGSHEVSADDNLNDLEAGLTVEQSINISPESGPTASSVTITGTGFRDDRDITISFDGEEIETNPPSLVSDDNGSFTASFEVPTCLNHTPEIRASDGRYTASTVFTILASINLDRSSARVGEVVGITGSGFRSSRRITLTFDGAAVDTMLSVRSDVSGCFEAEFKLPASPNGAHLVRASDGVEAAEADINTLASIALEPSSGAINAGVTVTGTGFGGDRVVTVRFAEDHVRTTATDAAGNFTSEFVVPPGPSGNYSVIAGDGLAGASGVFTVTTSIELNPVIGHVGSRLTLTGTGFSGAVTIRYGEQMVATTVADDNGAFSVSFSAPVSAHGHQTISASGSMNTIETTFTMESDAPPVPALLMPENDARQNARPSFSWWVVVDPSGVTYTLQIASDDSFSTLLLEKKGLTQAQYRLTREEGLNTTDRDAPYYWRVMAVDGAANESAWSTPRSFFVAFLPQWAIYVIIAAASVLISVLISRRLWHK